MDLDLQEVKYDQKNSFNRLINLELSLIQPFFQLKQSVDQRDKSDLIYPFKFPRSSWSLASGCLNSNSLTNLNKTRQVRSRNVTH